MKRENPSPQSPDHALLLECMKKARILAYVYNHSGDIDRDEAHERGLEAIARAVKRWPAMSDREERMKFTIASIRNAVIDSHRRGALKKSNHHVEFNDKVAHAFHPHRESELDTHRTLLAVMDYIQTQLPSEDRIVLELDLEGKTDEEIAEMMGRTVGWVKTRKHRAKTHLRETFRGKRPTTDA